MEQHYNDTRYRESTDDRESPKLLVKHILNIQPSDYDDLLNLLSADFPKYSDVLCEAAQICLKELPGNLMILAFFIDICIERPEMFEKFVKILHDCAISFENVFEFCVFVTNLCFLQMYGFIQQNEVENVLERAGLQDYTFLHANFECAKEIIRATRQNDENIRSKITLENLNLKTSEIAEDLKNLRTQAARVTSLCQTQTNDHIIGILMLKQLSFDITVCSDSLYLYFLGKSPKHIIHSILLAIAAECVPQTYIFTLFLRLARQRGFLFDFYEICPKILASDDLALIHGIRTILFLLFERFYKNQSETARLYVKSFGYDPAHDTQTINMFYTVVDLQTLHFFNVFTPVKDFDLQILEKLHSNIYPNDTLTENQTSSQETFDDSTLVNKHVAINGDTCSTTNRIHGKRPTLEQFREIFSAPSIEIPHTDFDLKNSIQTENFKKIHMEEKNSLYAAFFKLSEPSPSHFLSYFEILQSVLFSTPKHKETFFAMFFKIFKDRESYCDIIVEKLVYYNIIDQDAVRKFSELQSADITA